MKQDMTKKENIFVFDLKNDTLYPCCMNFQNFHGLLVFYTTIQNDDGPKLLFITKPLMIHISCGVFSVWLHSFLYTALVYILTTPVFFFSSGWARGNRGDRCSRSSLGLLTLWPHRKLSID